MYVQDDVYLISYVLVIQKAERSLVSLAPLDPPGTSVTLVIHRPDT
jgi:hypothetical protein